MSLSKASLLAERSARQPRSPLQQTVNTAIALRGRRREHLLGPLDLSKVSICRGGPKTVPAPEVIAQTLYHSGLLQSAGFPPVQPLEGPQRHPMESFTVRLMDEQ